MKRRLTIGVPGSFTLLVYRVENYMLIDLIDVIDDVLASSSLIDFPQLL